MPRASSGKPKIVKNFPSSENGPRVTCITKSKERYIITQCTEKMRFTLWHKIDEGFEQIATAGSPLDLSDMVPWDD